MRAISNRFCCSGFHFRSFQRVPYLHQIINIDSNSFLRQWIALTNFLVSSRWLWDASYASFDVQNDDSYTGRGRVVAGGATSAAMHPCSNWALREVIGTKKVKVAHTRLPSVGVPELIPVLGSQPAGEVSHKPGGRLPLLSARPAVTPATLKRASTNFAAWWTEAQWVWTVCLRQLPDSVATAIWTRALLRLSPAR